MDKALPNVLIRYVPIEIFASDHEVLKRNIPTKQQSTLLSGVIEANEHSYKKCHLREWHRLIVKIY